MIVRWRGFGGSRTALRIVRFWTVEIRSMLRTATFLLALLLALSGANAQPLEALLVRPSGSGRYPLILINHGSPRAANMRPDMEAATYIPIANEFARRGFAALIVMRRGYGSSGGNWAEAYGRCENPDYTKAGKAAAADLAAAIAHMSSRPTIDKSRIISIGVSAGGFATVALTADAPPGLVAGINFAGGRGSRDTDDVCEEDELVSAVGTFGRTSRVPMLWVYSQNDKFFGPALARKMRDAFKEGGGNVEFIAAPAFGTDGHRLFSPDSISAWTPYVDRFLAKLPTQPAATPSPAPTPSRETAAPKTASVAPSHLNARGKRAFESYLAAKTNKAFAASPDGSFGWRTGRSTIEEAKKEALELCEENADDCEIISINGTNP
jgi:dienelactone hydrolase